MKLTLIKNARELTTAWYTRYR